ncbi:MAG: hypothetical protein GWN00_11045, partial [Aliifodinibius sp.]|nr:hypothetical protein [Fodinibius sp.]NIV11708.1 hypothetical protein [Fodinibius sp.]NIY25322.1 hypothetical protein [Fodinibius sp.]
YSYECSLAITNRLVNETNAAEKATLLNKAIEFQKRGFELNPYWVTQEANTAALYWKEGNRYQAISLMNHAVETAPTYDMLLMNLGWMEEVTGNETSALQHYTRALRINPLINISTFSEFSQLLSVAAEDLNLWIDSDELWEDWYGMDRHDRGPKDFAYWKGIIAISTGQNELAIRYFEDSINRDFKNAKIFVYMAYAYS